MPMACTVGDGHEEEARRKAGARANPSRLGVSEVNDGDFSVIALDDDGSWCHMHHNGTTPRHDPGISKTCCYGHGGPSRKIR